MKERPLTSISSLTSRQFENFINSERLFPDLLNWADRVKEYFAVSNMLEFQSSRECTYLLHIASNAFLASFILDFQLQHYHALAILRIAIDASMQLSQISHDQSRLGQIWRQYNFAKPLSGEWKTTKKQFESHFCGARFERKYGDWMPRSALDALKQMWEYTSSFASHPSLLSVMFSAEEDNGVFKSGFFDIPIEGTAKDLGASLGLNINTTVHMTRVVVGALENLGQQLGYGSDRVEQLYKDWLDFTERKRTEWGARSEWEYLQ